MSDPDSSLVEACLAGDSGAFETLIEKYQGPVYALALRITGSPDDAMDVTQSTFVRAYEGLRGFDPRYRFFSWLYRIGVNQALNALQRRPRTEELPADPVDPADGPAVVAARAEVRGQVQDALRQLTAEHRVAIVLRHFQDLSYQEMGQVLGLPVKTVKSRLFEARRRLRVLLTPSGVRPVTGTRRLEQLLWQRQDGEIAPADRAWLEAELARDPEAAAMAAEVAAVHQVLAEAEPVQTPAALGARIRSAVDAASPPRRWGWRARRAGGPTAAASFPTWQRGWVYLAAGIVLGVGLSLVVRRGPDLDPADLAGSAGWSRSEEVAGQTLALAADRGSLAVGRRGGTLVLRLEWLGPGPAELALSGGGGLTVRDPEPPTASILRELGPAVWVLVLPEPALLTLEATPADPALPIEIEVRADGRSWARHTVRLGELPKPR